MPRYEISLNREKKFRLLRKKIIRPVLVFLITFILQMTNKWSVSNFVY